MLCYEPSRVVNWVVDVNRFNKRILSDKLVDCYDTVCYLYLKSVIVGRIRVKFVKKYVRSPFFIKLRC